MGEKSHGEDNMIRSKKGLMILAAGLLALGCAAKPKTSASQTVGATPSQNSAEVRMAELRQQSNSLTEVAAQLPGRTAADDRKLVADAFAKAGNALVLLGGPSEGGSFQQQLRIMENSRAVLLGSADVAPEPSADSGARAMAQALTSVRQRFFADNAALQPQFDSLEQHVAGLDNDRGPLHAVTVSEVFSSTSHIIQTMVGELEARSAALPAK
jgi:hypothetical protein